MFNIETDRPLQLQIQMVKLNFVLKYQVLGRGVKRKRERAADGKWSYTRNMFSTLRCLVSKGTKKKKCHFTMEAEVMMF